MTSDSTVSGLNIFENKLKEKVRLPHSTLACTFTLLLGYTAMLKTPNGDPQSKAYLLEVFAHFVITIKTM